MHYVIGDVHGCYKELMDLLNKIDKQDNEAVIYFVGDLLDRGPEVWKVLEWAMEHISLDGKYRCVRGNHEEMILDWYKEWTKWWNAGGFAETNPFGFMPETTYDFSKWADGMNVLHPDKLEPIMKFLRELPYNRSVDIKTKSGNSIRFRIVHAWYSNADELSVAEKRDVNLWYRNEFGNVESDEIIVHGHTPTVTGNICPGMIEYCKNAINLDGGCCFRKGYSSYPCMLCAICLETLEEFYPYTLLERFEQFEQEELLLQGTVAEDYVKRYEERYLQQPNPYRGEMLRRLFDN